MCSSTCFYAFVGIPVISPIKLQNHCIYFSINKYSFGSSPPANCKIIVSISLLMDGSKESVNYVHYAMHYNKFATVETSSEILKSCKENLPAFCFLLLCNMCSQAQNITKIGKSFRKINNNSKCLLVRLTCPQNSNMN